MFNKVILLLALTITSITTLSLPSANDELEKRGTWPWMRCFEPTDTYCRMDDHQAPGPRKKGLNFCTAFSLTTPRIGMWAFQTLSDLPALHTRNVKRNFDCHLWKRGSNQILIPELFSHGDDTDLKL